MSDPRAIHDPRAWLPQDRRLTYDEAADMQARLLAELVAQGAKQTEHLNMLRTYVGALALVVVASMVLALAVAG